MELKEAKRFRQDEFALQGTLGSFVRTWLERIAQLCPLRYLLQFVQKFFHRVRSALPWGGEVLVGSKPPAHPPVRPVRHAKKRLGTVTRVFLALLPTRLERVLICPDIMGGGKIPKETLCMLVNPLGKGSKRKQDDLCLEEHQCWVEMLLQELPEEDDPQDPTYEPSRSETDSEEYKSHNSTETDLEFEEKNGVVMLKEEPPLQEDPNGGDKMATEVPQTGEDSETTLELRTSGDGSEDPAGCNCQKDQKEA